MNLILIFCSFISVFSGIIFFAITGDLLMIFIPGIVNFLGLSIVGIIYKLLVKNEKRKNILHIIAYIRHYDIINKKHANL